MTTKELRDALDRLMAEHPEVADEDAEFLHDGWSLRANRVVFSPPGTNPTIHYPACVTFIIGTGG